MRRGLVMARYKQKQAYPGGILPGIFKELRRSAGFSRAQWAAQQEVSSWTIWAVEQGYRRPSQELLNSYGKMAEQQRCWKD